jgi:tetratricopeptide (TPR) repeat protein
MGSGRRDSRKPSREERREEALRPCARLGYDRDSLAVYFLEREMFALAEAQLRRAVWLNPYEPHFKAHLAWCLYRQDKFLEAREWAQKALGQKDEPNTRDLLELVERKLKGQTGRNQTVQK